MPSSSASDRSVRRAAFGITARYPSPITSDIASTIQFVVLKSRLAKFIVRTGLAGLS
jgi:hypothetical protein